MLHNRGKIGKHSPRTIAVLVQLLRKFWMFSKSRYRSPYQKKRQSRTRPLTVLLAIPVALVGLELLSRLVVGITGQSSQLANSVGEPPLVSAYRLKFLNSNQEPYPGLSSHGQLQAQRTFGTGYRLIAKQKNQFWQVNGQGFRDHQDVPIAKPAGEIRIFVLGNSTAFGLRLANNQQSFADRLETLLNQQVAQQKASPEKYRPDFLPYYRPELEKALSLPPRLREGRYRVINAAVPGYASGNELAQLSLKILSYKPDALIVLDGYGDLLLPSQQVGAEVPRTEEFLEDAFGYWRTTLGLGFREWLGNFYLVRLGQSLFRKPQLSVEQLMAVTGGEHPALEQQLPQNSQELTARIKRYGSHQLQIAQLAAAAKIPLIVALQPEITGRDATQLTPEERSLVSQLDANYIKGVQQGYQAMVPALKQVQKTYPQLRVLNFYPWSGNSAKALFQDPIHLTVEGHRAIGDRFYQTLQQLPQLQIPPANPQALELISKKPRTAGS